jgi:hypothetical protein
MSPDVRTTGVNETSSLNICSSSARLYAAGCELVHYQGPNGSLRGRGGVDVQRFDGGQAPELSVNPDSFIVPPSYMLPGPP